jgi:hypothetical protein
VRSVQEKEARERQSVNPNSKAIGGAGGGVLDLHQKLGSARKLFQRATKRLGGWKKPCGRHLPSSGGWGRGGARGEGAIRK